MLVRVSVVVIVFFVLISMCGCFLTVTQNLKDGSALLESAYDSLSDDYVEFTKSIDAYVDESTASNLIKLREFENRFKGGFEAVGVAIKAENELIQSLRTKEGN